MSIVISDNSRSFANAQGKPSIVIGAGKQAELLLDLIEWSGVRFPTPRFFDDRHPPGDWGPRGLAVEGSIDEGVAEAASTGSPAFVALGSKCAALRYRLHQTLKSSGVSLPTLIHPSVLTAPSAVVEEGATIFAGCILGPHVRVGAGSIIFHGVTLEHDTKVGANAWLAPRVATSGYVKIGEHAFIGTAAVISREAVVGPRCLVGAGAVVVSDLPADCIAYGCPATVRGKVREGMDAPCACEFEQNDVQQIPWKRIEHECSYA